MRGIRQLPPAPDAASTARRTREWNPVKGGLFVSGMLLLIVGLIVVWYNYPAYTHASSFQPDSDQLQLELDNIENSTPSELWDVWHVVRQRGLGSQMASPFVNARDAARRYQSYLVAASITSGVGVLLALISILIPGTQRRER